MVNPAIDIHCHLLPGVDDGAPDWETTLAMARVAAADAIGAIIATPHWPEGGSTDGPRIRALAVEAEQRLEEGGIPVRVFPGHELRVVPELLEALAGGEALPLAGTRFLLLETPYTPLPPFLRDVVFRLQSHRYRPILAHPERNPDVQREPGCLEAVVDAGCYLQVNAGSVLGQFGTRSRRAAEALLARGWVRFLASDAHSAVERPPRLAAAVRAAASLIGEGPAEALVVAAPFAVLQDMLPPVVEAAPVRRRRFGWLGL